MARMLVIGAGAVGLSTAMLLAGDGHDVTVVERDPAEPPDIATDAWHSWERRGVNQFRQIHFLQPRFRQLLESEVPHAARELDEAGALRFNPLRAIPDEITGGFRPGDEDYELLTARRPIAESALARAAAATPNVEVRRGVGIAGFVTGTPSRAGVPHVTGVTTEAGEELRVDLVVDASGRRSSLPAHLEAVGARPPIEEVEDCGFVYFTRHFRSADGALPPILGSLLMPCGTLSTLTLPADNGTWGLGIVASGHDPALRALKDRDTWMRVWTSFPLVAHWVDGEPIDGGEVAVMARIPDRHRSFVVDGEPVATGVLAVGDAWACTNPSLGRGISFGAIHARALRDVLRRAPGDDPVALALQWHDETLATVEPWYRGTLSFDRHRLADIDAGIAGEEYRPDDPAWEITNAMADAAPKDPEVFRAFLRVVGVLALPEEVLARPGVLDKVIELGSGWRDAPFLGPSREELLAIVAA